MGVLFMRNLFVVLPLILTGFVIAPATTVAQAGTVTVTIIYDNLWHDDRLEIDWGFAALIETGDQTILFDTGTRGDMFLRNFRTLGKDPNEIDALVISHAHGDHTGGMEALFETGVRPTTYLLGAFPAELRNRVASVTEVVEPEPGDEILGGVFTTGRVGDAIPEQSLVIPTANGLVVIMGCAHPGAVTITERVQELSDESIHLVMGGFHFFDVDRSQISATVDGMRNLGVEKIGVTHCSGMLALTAFSRAYESDFVPLGVGRVLTFPVVR